MFCVVPNSDASAYLPVDCSVQGALVVQTQAEYSANPFNMDMNSAVEVGSAIALLLATAWCVRMLRAAIF